MTTAGKYPREWLERVPAAVFGCFLPHELRIILFPGVGLANGGAERNVPIELVPFELRLPNSLLWVQLDDSMEVVRIWRRDDDSPQSG
jgi:hypothetical protein